MTLGKAITFCSIFLLVSCSGGSNDDGTPECGPNASCARPRPDVSNNPSVLGLWDRGGTKDNKTDVLYSYIGENSEYIVYDYEQDDFGSGENCYTVVTGSINVTAEDGIYLVRNIISDEPDVFVENEYELTINSNGSNLMVSFENWEIGEFEIWVLANGLDREGFNSCQ